MTNEEKEEIINRYNYRLLKYGYSEETLGWSKGKHNLRFEILLSFIKDKNSSILDFGCGFGDMYNYITRNHLNFSYLGCDINDRLLEVGRSKYPNINLTSQNLLKESSCNSVDYIVASGLHNYKINDNWSFIEYTFERFSKIAKKGFAVNFISDKVDIIVNDLYYSNPSNILNLAYKYSKKIILRNDYMPFEFTIFVDLNDLFDENKVIYPEFSKFLV